MGTKGALPGSVEDVQRGQNNPPYNPPYIPPYNPPCSCFRTPLKTPPFFFFCIFICNSTSNQQRTPGPLRAGA
jgi:hypothetical protein